jgi:gas vesicle protein
MSGGFVGGFILGLVVGATVALIAMARRGAEAMELFAQGAGQLRDRAGDLVDQVRQVRVEGDGQTAPAIEREIDDRADRVIQTATGIQ